MRAYRDADRIAAAIALLEGDMSNEERVAGALAVLRPMTVADEHSATVRALRSRIAEITRLVDGIEVRHG